MLSFPPHCSHRMQPLDVTVYGPLKRLVAGAQDAWMRSHPGMTMTIYDLPSILRCTFPLAATQSNITSGFRSTGISPLNPNIFTPSDYAPSYVTDRPDPTSNPLTPSNPGVTLEQCATADTTTPQPDVSEPDPTTQFKMSQRPAKIGYNSEITLPSTKTTSKPAKSRRTAETTSLSTTTSQPPRSRQPAETTSLSTTTSQPAWSRQPAETTPLSATTSQPAWSRRPAETTPPSATTPQINSHTSYTSPILQEYLDNIEGEILQVKGDGQCLINAIRFVVGRQNLGSYSTSEMCVKIRKEFEDHLEFYRPFGGGDATILAELDLFIKERKYNSDVCDMVLAAACNTLEVTAKVIQIDNNKLVSITNTPSRNGIVPRGIVYLYRSGRGLSSHYDGVVSRATKQFSPETVRPFPKAGPRKTTTKGRKRRYSAILTDTPERDALRQEENKRDEKNKQG